MRELSYWLFRTYDADLDDYVELPEPIPDTDERYAVLLRQSRERLRSAGR